MFEMLKTLIEQNKATMEMMKTQSDKNETPSPSNESTCTESGNANVSSDDNPTTNVDEMDSDDQEDNNLSYLGNEIINEHNSSNVDSALGLDNY